MGSFAALTRISPGPPKNALHLTAIARRKRLCSPFCAQREQGAEKENHTMYQNRYTLVGTLGRAADHGATNKPTLPVGSSISASDRAAGQPKRGPSAKYIPVYHIELVRDRLIKVEPRPAIHNSDDVVAILRDELLQADREKLVSLMLNTKNVVIGLDVVSVGSLSASIAHPRL